MSRLEWNGTIEQDGNDFVVFPEGDYEFTVSKVERGEHPGSEKIGPCPKANLELTVKCPLGTSTIKDALFLDDSVEWKLSSFFRSVGLKEHGKSYVMDWNGSIGRKGRAHIIENKYIGNNGKEYTNNKIEKYLDPLPEVQEESAEPLPW